MTKTFTRNDVIRFLYGEMQEDESESFCEILQTDSDLREEYLDQLILINQVEKTIINPPKRIIDNILTYSSSKSKDVENV